MHVQVSLTIEIGASASLTQMEQRIQEAGQQGMREALKHAIRQWEDQNHTCPSCGEKQRRLEGTTRRVIATTFGRVEVPRRRFRCQACLRRWCPANRLFTQLKGGTISQPLQEAAGLAGCSWPYRAASAVLKRLSGAHISAEEIRRLANRQGKQRAAQKPGGGRASMLLVGLGRPISREGRAADAGRIGWRLGVEPGAARRDGGQGGGDVFGSARSADANVFHHVFLERPGTKTSAQTTASSGPAALCGHLWPIAAAWPTGQSRSTDAL